MTFNKQVQNSLNFNSSSSPLWGFFNLNFLFMFYTAGFIFSLVPPRVDFPVITLPPHFFKNKQTNQQAPKPGAPSAYSESVVPGPWAECRPVRRHPQGADTIFMSKQNRHTGPFQHIPDIDGVIIITRKQQTTYKENEISKINSQVGNIFTPARAFCRTLNSPWAANFPVLAYTAALCVPLALATASPRLMLLLGTPASLLSYPY